MPRKAFIADVAAAAAQDIPGVSNVSRGDDDEEFVFYFTPTGSDQRPISITARASDLSVYPSQSHKFFLFTEEFELKEISDVLANYSEFTYGVKIHQLLLQIGNDLRKALQDGLQRAPVNIDEVVQSNDQSPVGNDSDSDFDDSWPDNLGSQMFHTSNMTPKRLGFNRETLDKMDRRIREDMRAVRDAGFYGGILYGMRAESGSSLVSVSVRVRKLGLSDEAIQAWDLQKNSYVILLIRYNTGYQTCDSIVSEAYKTKAIEFRVALSKSRKPTVEQAMAMFSTSREIDSANSGHHTSRSEKSGLRPLFISSSLNEFMDKQLTSLLKIRLRTGAGWDDAGRFVHENQGRGGLDLDTDVSSRLNDSPTNNRYTEPSALQKGLPIMVTADHVQQAQNLQLSFPLISMQFFMRYLTRCTEFCLVCHDKIEDKFEALKPYVCSRPLCLYQYMSLGFGPSVEHEIMTQPYVVDLLISFCYASAKSQRIREFPTGMTLIVPPAAPLTYPEPQFSQKPEQNIQQSSGQTLDVEPLRVKYDPIRYEIITKKRLELDSRSWVVLRTLSGGQKVEIHHKVIEVMHPTIRLSPVAIQRGVHQAPPQAPSTSLSFRHTDDGGITARTTRNPQLQATTLKPSELVEAELTIYQKNFDDLDNTAKTDTIAMLLETIPTVREMRDFLRQREGLSAPRLVEWNERISPAALGLLRWIIASNRSCIVQVDEITSQSEPDEGMTIDSLRLEERISGVDGLCQFRFAQGAPDKENRFKQALSDTKSIHSPKYPTLFAWHGSSLANWHSIIRTGLDFKEVKNGRAFGDGCYFSQEYVTSQGYSGYHGFDGLTWPGSELKIRSAMCLNEIINAPEHFRSKFPHLVVQHVDWIQTRYLFVKTGDIPAPDTDNGTVGLKKSNCVPRPTIEIEQDPLYTAKGSDRQPIGIPRGAFPSSRDLRCKSHPIGSVPTPKHFELMINDEVVPLSDEEDIEDLNFLVSDEESPEIMIKGKGKSRKVDHEDTDLDSTLHPSKRVKGMTNFTPGILNRTSIQLLAPPSYATPSATRQLQRELKIVLALQSKTPLHELGWYLDQRFVENVYQWIVELHSFDTSLPLAKDMENSGMTSVIIEIRFGKDYPISPPFVRVIRPRFLPRYRGGGGHVTQGGAMCMELLTNTGWSAVSSIESVLLQVRLAISNMEGNPARLEVQDSQNQRDYGIGEAMAEYIRSCNAHGWEVPKDFRDLGMGGSTS